MELTTIFKGITTSLRPGKKQMSPAMAVAHVKANLRYITRTAAAAPENTLYFGGGADRSRDQFTMKNDFLQCVEQRAKKGGKQGTRVAEKIILSLPNEFLGEPAREAVRMIAQKLSEGSAEVRIVAAIHTDRPGNLHAHLLVLDGLEDFETARSRSHPGTQRIRRKFVVRLGDRGRPREMRSLIAECINVVSLKYRYKKVEHLSYADRGLSKKPGRHEAPKSKYPKKEESIFKNDDSDLLPINELFGDNENVRNSNNELKDMKLRIRMGFLRSKISEQRERFR